MNILVTGGAGFIGYHTCKELCSQGHNIIIFDNLSSGNEHSVDELMDEFPEQITFFYGDVIDLHKWDFQPDAILHLAAKVSVEESIAFPALTSYTNIISFVAVCEFAKHKKIPRVIYASSAAVYGNVFSCDEKDTCQTFSPYGIDKLTNELYAQLYTNLYGIEFVGLRYFNVYGPKQNSHYAGVISKFISNIKNDEPLTIYGDGGQHRNFIYVEDVAKINVHALTGGFNNFVVNIGSPKGQCSVMNLVSALEHITEKKLIVKHEPPKIGDIYRSVPNLTRLSFSYPGFHSMNSIESGLRKMLEESNS